MPQRDLVHVHAAGQGCAGHLTAGLQHDPAALEAGRRTPAEIAGQRGWGHPPTPLPTHQPSDIKAEDSPSAWIHSGERLSISPTSTAYRLYAWPAGELSPHWMEGLPEDPTLRRSQIAHANIASIAALRSPHAAALRTAARSAAARAPERESKKALDCAKRLTLDPSSIGYFIPLQALSSVGDQSTWGIAGGMA